MMHPTPQRLGRTALVFLLTLLPALAAAGFAATAAQSVMLTFDDKVQLAQRVCEFAHTLRSSAT